MGAVGEAVTASGVTKLAKLLGYSVYGYGSELFELYGNGRLLLIGCLEELNEVLQEDLALLMSKAPRWS